MSRNAAGSRDSRTHSARRRCRTRPRPASRANSCSTVAAAARGVGSFLGHDHHRVDVVSPADGGRPRSAPHTRKRYAVFSTFTPVKTVRRRASGRRRGNAVRGVRVRAHLARGGDEPSMASADSFRLGSGSPCPPPSARILVSGLATRDQDLLDAARLHLLGRETRFERDLLSLVGDRAERPSIRPRPCPILVRQLDAGARSPLSDRDLAVDAERAVADLDDLGLLRRTRRDLADELLEQVLEGTRPDTDPYSSVTSRCGTSAAASPGAGPPPSSAPNEVRLRTMSRSGMSCVP